MSRTGDEEWLSSTYSFAKLFEAAGDVWREIPRSAAQHYDVALWMAKLRGSTSANSVLSPTGSPAKTALFKTDTTQDWKRTAQEAIL